MKDIPRIVFVCAVFAALFAMEGAFAQNPPPDMPAPPDPDANQPAADLKKFESEKYAFSVTKPDDPNWRFRNGEGDYGVIQLVKMSSPTASPLKERPKVAFYFYAYSEDMSFSFDTGKSKETVAVTNIKRFCELNHETNVTKNYTDIMNEKKTAEYKKYPKLFKKAFEYSFTGRSTFNKSSADLREIFGQGEGTYVWQVQIVSGAASELKNNEKEIEAVLKSITIEDPKKKKKDKK